jgi:hypothetical protein
LFLESVFDLCQMRPLTHFVTSSGTFEKLASNPAAPMREATDFPVAWILETEMKTEGFMIAGVTAIAMLVAGSALAQNSTGPSTMQQQGPGGAGPGMMQHMARGMGPCMGMGMTQRMGMGMGAGMMQGGLGPTQIDPAQLETLKADLGITPAQEAAWAKYSNALRDVATTMKSIREAAKTAGAELLVALNDEQKAKAHEILPGLATPGPGMMGGMGGGNRSAP